MAAKPKVVSVPVGGLWESDWEIQYDARVPWGTKPDRPCPHCHDRTVAIRTVGGPPWSSEARHDETLYTWTCPRVIVMHTEAGYATTGLCLDCVLDWGKAQSG